MNDIQFESEKLRNDIQRESRKLRNDYGEDR